jgi:hypothetical protein
MHKFNDQLDPLQDQTQLQDRDLPEQHHKNQVQHHQQDKDHHLVHNQDLQDQ